MAWTKQQRAAHSERMKKMWDRKKAPAYKAKQEYIMNPINHADMVNNPPHYTATKYQPADVADEWFPNEPLLWNSNKYLARWDKKGDPIENLEKAVWYIQRKINKLKAAR